MKHTKSKSSSNSSAPAASPSKGKGDRGKGKGSLDSNGSGSNKISIKDKERRDSLAMGADKELRGDSIDLKDCPLRLPEFANVDHGKLVPRYTSGKDMASSDRVNILELKICNSNLRRIYYFYITFIVLRRSEHDGIGLEDVDTLQLELEALLSATVVRKFTLKEETKVVINLEKYKSGGKLHKRVILHIKIPNFIRNIFD